MYYGRPSLAGKKAPWTLYSCHESLRHLQSSRFVTVAMWLSTFFAPTCMLVTPLVVGRESPGPAYLQCVVEDAGGEDISVVTENLSTSLKLGLLRICMEGFV